MSTGKCIKPHATNTSARTLRGLVLVMALAALLFPVAAWAGTIGVPLTDGTLTLIGGVFYDAPLTATGPEFTISAVSGVPAFCGPFGSQLGCATPAPLDVSISTGALGVSIGRVTYAGVMQTISSFPAPAGQARASLTVNASSILMPPIGDPFTRTTPFFLDLQVSLADCATCDMRSTVIHAAGGGDATFSFAPSPSGSLWLLTSAVYQITIPINPVPEPSTWLLVPTAVGLAWLARKKVKAT